MLSIRLVRHAVVKTVGMGIQMESKRTTVRDLRRHNRSALLSKLFFDSRSAGTS